LLPYSADGFSKVAERRSLAGGRTVMNMETMNFEAVVGRRCRLLKPVRDHEGLSRYAEKPRILRSVDNLGRRMLLVQFDDGATTFLFPDEVTVE